MPNKRAQTNGKSAFASKNAQPSDIEESRTEQFLSRTQSHGKIGEKSDIYISLIVVVYLTTTTYNLLGLIGLSLVNLRTRL